MAKSGRDKRTALVILLGSTFCKDVGALLLPRCITSIHRYHTPVKTDQFTGSTRLWHVIADPWFDGKRVDDEDDEDDGNEVEGCYGGKSSTSSYVQDDDSMQAELTLRNAPCEPHPDWTADTVARTVCRALQWVDHPTPGSGLKRCYSFFSFECRKAVTARQGATSLDAFIRYGLLSPALQPFMGARRVDLGSPTLTPAQPPLRGALMSIPVHIQGASVFSVQYPSGMIRSGVVAEPPETHMVLRLEQQRRPPNQGCWMVREVLDVRHAFAGDMGNAHVGG